MTYRKNFITLPVIFLFMRENEQNTNEDKFKNSHFSHDGAYPEEDDLRTMGPSDFITFENGNEKKGKSVEKVFVGHDSIDDLSARVIGAIGNPIRLKILLYLDAQSNKPEEYRDITDETGIFRYLKSEHQIVNTGLRQNHLKPLTDAGLIRRKKGFRNDDAVWIYETVPGSMESLILILTNLNRKVKKLLDEQSLLQLKYPVIKVLGGPQDQDKYEIHQTPTMLGRIGVLYKDDLEVFSDAIIFSNKYKSVTRLCNDSMVYNPHAKLFCQDNEWYIEDCGNNKCGTFVNDQKVIRKKLKDYDIIGLSRGKYSVDLLFRKPNYDLPKYNYIHDLENVLSPEDQKKMVSKITQLLSKVKPEFFMETLDKMIEKMQEMQEIENIIPVSDEKDILELKLHDKHDWSNIKKQ
jgi:hypothetical protein